MIEEKDIYRCIEENKAPYIRLYDMNKNLLHIYDDNSDVQSAVNHLQAVLPMFKGYGKIIVNCCNETMKKCNWKGSYYMNLHFANAPAGGQMAGPLNAWNMPPGYVHQDVMMAKLESIEKSISLNREIDELKRAAKEKDNQDPAKQIEKFFPYALYAMGKPIDEIAKVSQAIRIGNANLGITGAASQLPVNSLTFKDIEAKPSEEKQKQFQDLVDSVSKKVSIEEMIMLYDSIDKDPSLVQTALQALPLLKK